jgi:hypothetical protein
MRRRPRFVLVCIFALAILLTAVPSHATLINLVNGNSVTQIDPASSAGQMNWLVDGANQIAQQWFWVKIGAGSAVPISSLSPPTLVAQNSNSVTLSYTGMGVTAQTTFTLNGGSAGSGVSDIPISINVTNNTATATSISIFEYANFDLNASAAGDLLNIVADLPAGFIQQKKGTTAITEKNSISGFDHWQGGSPASVLGPGAGSVLSGILGDSPTLSTQIGPGDESWAVQWNATLAATGQIGSTFGVSKDEHITGAFPAPEPSSIIIGAIGFTIGGVFAARRRS